MFLVCHGASEESSRKVDPSGPEHQKAEAAEQNRLLPSSQVLTCRLGVLTSTRPNEYLCYKYLFFLVTDESRCRRRVESLGASHRHGPGHWPGPDRRRLLC